MYEKYFKRLFDVICALAAIIVFSWLYIIVAVLVRIKLGSPVIFKQARPGLDGKIFTFGIDEKNMFVLFVAVLILFGVSVLQENGMKMRETLAKQNIAFRWAVYFIALIFVLVFGVYGPAYNAADFIYGAY